MGFSYLREDDAMMMVAPVPHAFRLQPCRDKFKSWYTRKSVVSKQRPMDEHSIKYIRLLLSSPLLPKAFELMTPDSQHEQRHTRASAGTWIKYDG